MGLLRNRILGIDSRKKERTPICVLVEEPGVAQEYFDKSHDLSESGMFVETDRLRQKGEPVELRFALPGKPVVTVRGMVTRVAKRKNSLFGSDKNPQGLGIQFTELDSQSERIIRNFVRLDF